MGVPKVLVLDWSSSSSVENLKPGSSSWHSTSKIIRQALENYSFFEVIFDKPVVELGDIYSAEKELFDLPLEIKKKNIHPLIGLRYKMMNPQHPESFGIDNVTSVEACTNFTNIMWPHGNDHFCKNIHSYAAKASQVEKLAMKMLFESYGLDEKHYEEHAKSATSQMRLMKYEKTRFNAHMDKTFFTIVHQNQINGLEIRAKNGEWIPYFPSSPSSFAILAGDICMAWSNDRIKSAYHRVSVNEEGDRYTLAFFTSLKGVIMATEELVDEEYPLQYKPFKMDDLLQFYESNMKNPAVRECNIVRAYCDEVLKP